MTDFSQMIRWNANFVRGLAQSVLERAKVIRSTLAPYTGVIAGPGGLVQNSKPGRSTKKITVKKSAKRPVAKRSTKPALRKSKKT